MQTLQKFYCRDSRVSAFLGEFSGDIAIRDFSARYLARDDTTRVFCIIHRVCIISFSFYFSLSLSLWVFLLVFQTDFGYRLFLCAIFQFFDKFLAGIV